MGASAVYLSPFRASITPELWNRAMQATPAKFDGIPDERPNPAFMPELKGVASTSAVNLPARAGANGKFSHT